MMYLIVGGELTERRKAREKVWKQALEELDLAVVSVEELAARASTMTLTGEVQGYLLRGAFSAEKGEDGRSAVPEEVRDALLEMAPGLAASAHTFIFEEEKLTAKLSERLKKAGARVEELAPREKKEAPFNVFALGDALAKRDRKALWLLLTKALRQGLAPENIAGVLAWKARTMLASARDAREREQLVRVSRELVLMYHDSHRGAGELGLLLERFALML